MRCWNETQQILNWMAANGYPDRSSESFLKFWSYFQVFKKKVINNFYLNSSNSQLFRVQNRSLAELDKAYGHKQDIILWTSDLTSDGHAELYLDRNRYIIQV